MPTGIYDRVWLRGHTYAIKETECKECNTTILAKRSGALCAPCKTKHAKAHQKYSDKNRNYSKRRSTVLKRVFGISLEEYKKMSEQQKDQCAICKKNSADCGRALDVDHDHETGMVRGLLCNQCNNALGLLKDNIESLRNAIIYLCGDKSEQ